MTALVKVTGWYPPLTAQVWFGFLMSKGGGAFLLVRPCQHGSQVVQHYMSVNLSGESGANPMVPEAHGAASFHYR